MKIHEQLREERRQRHMTQGDVAKEAGLERETYTRIERGRQGTTVSTMQRLGEILGLTLTFIKKSQKKIN